MLPPRIRDHKIKPLHRFFRLYFSPNLNSYEMDYVYGGQVDVSKRYYLACINLNSKYLFMVPLELGQHGSLERTMSCVQRIKDTVENITPGATVKYIRGDADKAFGTVIQQEEPELNAELIADDYIQLGHKRYVSNIFTRYLRDANIELFLTSSPYTNKNRVVDRAIRTIRDMLGENQNNLFDTDMVREAVERYNTSPHSSFNYEFTPEQVQMNPDLEEYYIRQQMALLQDVKNLQIEEGFFNYKHGDILLIHLDESKTQKKLTRKRRAFNKLAEFSNYENGNVKCKVLVRVDGNIVARNPVVIPIYYTTYVANSIQSLPRKYHQLVF
jgi:hypothetical protein